MTNNSDINSDQQTPSWLKESLDSFKQDIEIIDHSPWFIVKKGYRQREEIEVFNASIFGNTEGHILIMRFFDGFAIQRLDCDEAKQPLIMLYPTGNYLWNNKKMSLDIVDFSGDDYVTPFEVALKYGKLFTYNQVIKEL